MAHFVYDALIGAGNNLRQVSSHQYNPGPQIRRARTSGGIDPSAHYLLGSDPRSQLVTTDIAGLLSFCSVTAGTGLLSSDTIYCPYQVETNGGTFVSGSNHNRLSGTKGIAYPVSFQANQNGVVTANVEIVWLSTTGFAAPVALNTGVALQAGAFVGEYLFGDIYANLGAGAAQISEAVGWQVNTGIRVTTKMYNGGIFPSACFITMRDPTMTITFENLAVAANFVPVISAMTTASVYARPLADGGGFAAVDASGAHLKLSFGTGIAQLDSINVQENEQGQAAVTLLGTTLAASTASTIP